MFSKEQRGITPFIPPLPHLEYFTQERYISRKVEQSL